MLYRRGTKTDPCETPFLRHRNLLCVPLPVVRVKLQFVTSSMIILNMCLSGSKVACSWGRSAIWDQGCCDINKCSIGLLFHLNALLDILSQQSDLIYGWSLMWESRWLPREERVAGGLDTPVDKTLEGWIDNSLDTLKAYLAQGLWQLVLLSRSWGSRGYSCRR